MLRKKRFFVFALLLFILSGFFINHIIVESKALKRGRENIIYFSYNRTLKNTIHDAYKQDIIKYDLNKKKAELKKKLETKKEKENIYTNFDPYDGTDFKTVFKDSLFLGDSITSGLQQYKLLDKENVIYGIGLHVYQVIEKKNDEIKKKNPKNLFIMLGMNDSVWVETEKFSKNYDSLIKTLKKEHPNTKIFIQSIFPVDKKNKEATAKISNERVKEYNDALIKIAKDNEVTFVDLRPILSAHQEFYGKDGIHLFKDLYLYWLKFIQTNVIN